MKNPRCCKDEPGDHALGRSRGGLSTKFHAAVDGRGRPLVILLTPGQAGDAPMMLPLLAELRIPRPCGRPRTRPNKVLADTAYSSRAVRTHLRQRGITAVIPESVWCEQVAYQRGGRRRRGHQPHDEQPPRGHAPLPIGHRPHTDRLDVPGKPRP